MLELEQVGRRIPAREGWLIRDVSLTLEESERLVICGRSGSGKSVLLRVIAMLDPFDAGEIYWNREAVGDAAVPSYRSQCIYLHQRAPMEDDTVEANLRLPFQLGTQQPKSYRADFIIDSLGQVGRTPEFLQRSSRDLSGGERQIVALLRAIQLDPQVLLLDEPTSAADSETVVAIESLIANWLAGANKRALIWVTHDGSQAKRVGDRQLRMEDGVLEEGKVN